MKTLEVGEKFVIPKSDTRTLARHSRRGYETVLHMDGVRSVDYVSARASTACKFPGYCGWYLGTWTDEDGSGFEIESGPYEKLAAALVVMKLEASNGT